MGVALVTERASLDDAALSLAQDVVPFDQRGCLSPRVAVVLGDAARAVRFGACLDEALARAAETVPRGTVHPDERAEATRDESTMAFAGTVFARPTHVVGIAAGGGALAVPPSGRHVHVAAARDLGAARALLAPLAHVIVAVGSDDPERVASVAPAHARVSPIDDSRMAAPVAQERFSARGRR
jgi:hypothetical protein